MKSSRGITVIIIILIVTLIIGGSFVAYKFSTEKKVSNSTSEKNSDWKTYRNDTYGVEFKYPANYSVSIPPQSSDIPGIVDIRNGQNLIRVLVDNTSQLDSVETYLKSHAPRDGNTDKEYPIKNFIQRKLGDNIFYSILTERFEGTLAFSYYTVINKKAFLFLISSEGVAWSNPDLDIENDAHHTVSREILSTFKVTN